ncbi:MAG TPA: hypothetical protein VF757_06515 [Sphingomicrobium sp.]
MNRFFAFLFALLLTSISVASACTAAPAEWVQFKLEPAHRGGGAIEASFRDDSRANHENNWSTSFGPSELVGLDVAGFRSVGTRPLRFAVVREAGRLDCAGQGGNSYATGNCRLTLNPGFAQLLQSRGIASPTQDESWALMALDVRSSLINAIATARYPTPTISQLIELTAVGVNGDYIAGLARAGYRPESLHSLVEFRAVGVTPEWIGGFTRIGYANIPIDELVQLKALNISGDYVAGFQRLGYRGIRADELVQLKALNITPEYVAGFERLGYHHLPVDKLVQLKSLDITPEFVRSSGVQPGSNVPVDDLVQMKIFGRRR